MTGCPEEVHSAATVTPPAEEEEDRLQRHFAITLIALTYAFIVLFALIKINWSHSYHLQPICLWFYWTVRSNMHLKAWPFHCSPMHVIIITALDGPRNASAAIDLPFHKLLVVRSRWMIMWCALYTTIWRNLCTLTLQRWWWWWWCYDDAPKKSVPFAFLTDHRLPTTHIRCPSSESPQISARNQQVVFVASFSNPIQRSITFSFSFLSIFMVNRN